MKRCSCFGSMLAGMAVGAAAGAAAAVVCCCKRPRVARTACRKLRQMGAAWDAARAVFRA